MGEGKSPAGQEKLRVGVRESKWNTIVGGAASCVSDDILCILDASVMLDFIAGEIFPLLFSSPYHFITSDIIAEEEINRSYTRSQLLGLGLIIKELEPDELLRIMDLQEQYPELSIKDLSVYLLSEKFSGIMVTGDGALRKFAEAHRIAYHGTLWLLDHMVERKLLLSREGAAALKRMLGRKRWLPRKECEKRIVFWEERE